MGNLAIKSLSFNIGLDNFVMYSNVSGSYGHAPGQLKSLSLSDCLYPPTNTLQGKWKIIQLVLASYKLKGNMHLSKGSPQKS